MTKVYLERNGDRYTVACKDHATGSEAVCAAVSTLCYTLAGYLHNIPCEIEKEELLPGDARIAFYGKNQLARAAFDMICVGFLQLAASYPDFVSVEIQEIE